MTSVVTAAGTVTFYKLSPHHIHVYTNSTRKAVINSVEPISCLSVEVLHPNDAGPSDMWMLWMGSNTGKVYCVDSLSLQTSGEKGKTNDNQDIFNTLLASQLQSQHGIRKNEKLVSNLVRVFPSESKLQLGAPVVSIGTGQGLLCVCTLINSISGKSYVITLLCAKALSSCNTNGDDVVPLWRKHLPAEGLEYADLRTVDNADNHMLIVPLPVVYLVSSSSLWPSDDEISAYSSELFSALFGSESTLMDTMVLIFGSPSGVMFYFRMKSFQPDDNLEVLCALNQPVFAIHIFAIPCNGKGEMPLTNSSFLGSSQVENHPPVVCLAVIGHNGKCLLIFQSGDTLQYQTLILPGPIASVFALTMVMYISTDKDLYRCRLSCVEKDDKKKKFEVSLSSLGISGICGIYGESGSTLGTVELCLFSRNGRLYTLTDEGEGSERNAVAATQMRDLLLSIGNTSHEMDRVKGVLGSQIDVLSQLALATKMAALTSGTATEKATKLRKLKKIVKVKVGVRQDCLGSRREFSILVRLTKESVGDLSSDWLIIVRVDQFQDIEGEITVSNFSKSLPLVKGLRPECFEEIQIPLEGKQLKIPLFAVTTFLVYNVPKTGFEKVIHAKSDSLLTEYLNSSSQGDRPALCIPIQEDKLNILDFLHFPDVYQSKTSQSSSRSYHSLYNSEMFSCDEIALELARQRPTYGLYFPSEDSRTQTTIHTVTVNLQGEGVLELHKCRNSTEVLKMMLSLMSLESAVKGETTLVRVSTPKGHQVTVSVSPNQSKGSEASSRDQSELSSHKTGYILTLQSEDLLTLVLLRSGFIERLSVNMTSASRDGDVQEKQIRSLLHTYQELRKTIEDVELPRPMDDNQKDDVKNCYCAVHEQLRNVPLPLTCHTFCLEKPI